MAFRKKLRLLDLEKQALAAEAQALRDSADLEWHVWRGRLARVARLTAVAGPIVAALRLLRR